MSSEQMYLIDGIRVTKRIFERRQIWGEYQGANFQVIEIRHTERFTK